MRFLIKLNNKISLLKPSTSSSSSGHSCYKQPFDYLCFSEESELVHARVHLLEDGHERVFDLLVVFIEAGVSVADHRVTEA